MVADIVEVERLFLAIPAETRRDDADIRLALGRLPEARGFGTHGFQELQRHDFAAFIDHRLDARLAAILEDGEGGDLGVADGLTESHAKDFGQAGFQSFDLRLEHARPSWRVRSGENV